MASTILMLFKSGCSISSYPAVMKASSHFEKVPSPRQSCIQSKLLNLFIHHSATMETLNHSSNNKRAGRLLPKSTRDKNFYLKNGVEVVGCLASGNEQNPLMMLCDYFK